MSTLGSSTNLKKTTRNLKRSRTLAHIRKFEADTFVTKDELKHMLNGYARVIEFGTNHIDKRGNFNPTIDPSQNFILQLSEGQIRNGMLCGYSRTHDNEGECKVGYWSIMEFDSVAPRADPPSQLPQSSQKLVVSRPYGKFAHYFKDGSFRTPDGLYFGNDKVWNKLVLKK